MLGGAPPLRGFAAYLGEVLVFAFADGAGPILPAMTGRPPLAQHAALHGRVHVVDVHDRVTAAVGKAKTGADLATLLKADGFDVRPTPLSALGWALR